MGKIIRIDPRTGLALLVLANVIAFAQDNFRLEAAWIAALVLLTVLCGRTASAVKFTVGFGILLLLQWYILPLSPKIIAVGFSVLVNYARKVYPCLMVGSLMVKTISLRELIAGLRSLHVPQSLIIPISVTIRYFPAIREETGHIRDAMSLRNVHGLEKAEAMVVPLIISAANTAEELSAAAVTRGIENPVKKTSMVELHIKSIDIIVLAVSAVFTVSAFLI